MERELTDIKDQIKNIHDHNVATFISRAPISGDTPKHPIVIDVTSELIVHENILITDQQGDKPTEQNHLSGISNRKPLVIPEAKADIVIGDLIVRGIFGDMIMKILLQSPMGY